MSEAVNEFLEHYGVKGMKWGVRKDRGGGGSRRSKSDSKTPETKKTPGRKGGSSKSSSEDISKVSDDDLKRLINRLEMEKKYKELTTSESADGKLEVQKFFQKQGGKTLDTVLDTATRIAVKKLFNL